MCKYTAIINCGSKNKTIHGTYGNVLGKIAEAMLDRDVNSVIVYKDEDKLTTNKPTATQADCI